MSAWAAMDLWTVWFAFCGILVNAWLGWHLGKALSHVLWAAAAAASCTRWSYAVGKEHGFREGLRLAPWTYAPVVFFQRWWSFIASDRGMTSIRSSAGHWEGIGRWMVYPAAGDKRKGGAA